MRVPSRRVKVFPNNKPWFTPSLYTKLKSREQAFKSGDRAPYRKATYDVQRAIRGAKINYRKKPDDRLLTGDARAVWQGLLCQFPVTRGRVLPPQTTTPKSAAAPDDDPQARQRMLPPQTTHPLFGLQQRLQYDDITTETL